MLLTCPICSGRAALYGRAPLDDAMAERQPRLNMFLPAFRAAGISGQQLFLCRDCGHGFVSPTLDDEAVVSAETEGKTGSGWTTPEFLPRTPDLWRDKIRVPTFHRLVQQHASGARKALDIGARGGTISLGLGVPEVDLMQADRGFALCEPSERVRIFSGLLSDLEATYSADLILALHVLEHVDDPVGFLRDVRDRLDGVAIIEVPFEHADAWSVAAGQICSLNHKQYFTPWSFRRALAEAGLKPLHFETDIHFHTGYPGPAPAPCPVIRAVVKRGGEAFAEPDALARTLNAWHGSFAGTVALNEPFDLFLYSEGCVPIADFYCGFDVRDIYSTNPDLIGTDIQGRTVKAPAHPTGNPFLICLEWFSREPIQRDLGQLWRVI